MPGVRDRRITHQLANMYKYLVWSVLKNFDLTGDVIYLFFLFCVFFKHTSTVFIVQIVPDYMPQVRIYECASVFVCLSIVVTRASLALSCSSDRARYTTVDRFSWDQGSYNSPKVSVYVPLEGVGAAKERVSCSFTARGFDLT